MWNKWGEGYIWDYWIYYFQKAMVVQIIRIMKKKCDQYLTSILKE